jgi:hypothetical protein
MGRTAPGEAGKVFYDSVVAYVIPDIFMAVSMNSLLLYKLLEGPVSEAATGAFAPSNNGHAENADTFNVAPHAPATRALAGIFAHIVVIG